MINASVKYESSYFFICLLTGILIFVETFIYFVINNIPINDIDKVFTIIPAEIVLFFISYILGMFVHGIRYYAFSQYIPLYYRSKDAYKKYEEKMDKMPNGKKKKKPYKYSILMRILKYLFRDDTTIEVLLKTKRNNILKQYKWINDSAEPVEDIWPKAILVSKEIDNNVYKFLYYSEFFQCFNTAFIILFFLFGFFTLYSFINNNFDNKLLNIIFLTSNVLFHMLSRKIAITFASRFFLDIDSCLKYLSLKDSYNRNTDKIL
jgi:hypothetical protein